MPKGDFETVQHDDDSITVFGTGDAREAIMFQDLGGIMTFAVAARITQGAENIHDESAVIDVHKDVINHTVLPWVEERIETHDPADMDILVPSIGMIVGLTTDYNEKRGEINALQRELRDLTRKDPEQEATNTMGAFMQQAIEEQGGVDAIRKMTPEQERKFKAEIIAKGVTAHGMSLEAHEPEVEALKEQIKAESEGLESTIGAELEELKGDETYDLARLMIRELNRLPGYDLTREPSPFTGLVEENVRFGKLMNYRLPIIVPRHMSTVNMPMTFEETAAFADRMRAATAPKKSIYDRL